jgi:hypothetical protein
MLNGLNAKAQWGKDAKLFRVFFATLRLDVEFPVFEMSLTNTLF